MKNKNTKFIKSHKKKIIFKKKMKKIFFLLSLLLLTIKCVEDYSKEENVLILTDWTFDKATTEFKNILVLF